MLNIDLSCSYSCPDTNGAMIFPNPEIDPGLIRIAMVSEAPATDFSNYFYKSTTASFFQTTATAFQDAGIIVKSWEEITELGIYLTTAIKCCKKDYLVSGVTIKKCAELLEKELDQFSGLRVIMCMGDFAIKAVNSIYKRKYGISPIKRGSTYKIRKEVHELNGMRFFPSYTQTGESFNLEKSKRRMIAGDIKNALEYISNN